VEWLLDKLGLKLVKPPIEVAGLTDRPTNLIIEAHCLQQLKNTSTKELLPVTGLYNELNIIEILAAYCY